MLRKRTPALFNVMFLSAVGCFPARVCEREHDTGWRLPHDKARRACKIDSNIPEPAVYRVSCYYGGDKNSAEKRRENKGRGSTQTRLYQWGR